jgi:hypothetical protein
LLGLFFDQRECKESCKEIGEDTCHNHHSCHFTFDSVHQPATSSQPSFACLSPSQPTADHRVSAIDWSGIYPSSQPQVRLARSDPSCQLLTSQSIQPIHPAIQPRLLHVCFVTKSTCKRCFAVPNYELVVAGDNTFLWWAIQNRRLNCLPSQLPCRRLSEPLVCGRKGVSK